MVGELYRPACDRRYRGVGQLLLLFPGGGARLTGPANGIGGAHGDRRISRDFAAASCTRSEPYGRTAASCAPVRVAIGKCLKDLGRTRLEPGTR